MCTQLCSHTLGQAGRQADGHSSDPSVSAQMCTALMTAAAAAAAPQIDALRIEDWKTVCSCTHVGGYPATAIATAVTGNCRIGTAQNSVNPILLNAVALF